ncbi:cytochrome P450 [Kibdelosporangium persicum]|uniref:Nocardicin N-oxygenase n=1 Tax=Kibdelosporangium persicum TaxID=2698649 RepID=A0ABX2FJG2_9PSEU|nr:cytochrome P450 [Kibdelosporangium persicum]NRN70970.1 Nocardicin N-oxygenase [Kibdelosporangium persicum]
MTSTTDTSTLKQPRDFPFGGVVGVGVDPLYRWLLENEPVSRIRLKYGDDAWLVTRHADVQTVLRSPSFSRAMAREKDVPRGTAEDFSTGMVSMDPPDHTKLRGLVSGPFTRSSVLRLQERVVEIADELVEQIAKRNEPFDVAEMFSIPLTLTLICEVLGVPYEDRAQFRRWAEDGMADDADEEAALKLWQYHNELLLRRRAEPVNDLLSVIATDGHAQGIDDTELAMLAMTVLVAGYLSAGTQLPTMIYVLLTRPELRQQLLDHPEIMPTAVDELIRWIPLEVHGAPPRYAVEDVELSGTLVRAGDALIASTTAANRDPRVFTDPERIDLTRAHNPHLGFGAGAHYCLGAQLAKAELEIGLRSLLSRFPELRLAVPEEGIGWKHNYLTRGVQKLPVTW